MITQIVMLFIKNKKKTKIVMPFGGSLDRAGLPFSSCIIIIICYIFIVIIIIMIFCQLFIVNLFP